MKEIFLSASVPIVGRGDYYESANPFLIQCAVRELVTAIIKNNRLVWGGHPAITPMIWTICEDVNVDYSQSVVLYQSKYFQDQYPEENARFHNVVYVDGIDNDREASLYKMRIEMLSRRNLAAAVFVGGMEGVEVEYGIFKQQHPQAKTLIVPAPGGAAQQLAHRLGVASGNELHDVDFAAIYYRELLLSSVMD